MSTRSCGVHRTTHFRIPSYFGFLQRYGYIYIFSHLYFPASGQAVVKGVVPSAPRFLPSIFIARIGFSNPTARRFFIKCVANSRSRTSRKTICAQEKVPTNLCEYMLSAGLELTKLTYTRLEDNLLRHRGDRDLDIPTPNECHFFTLTSAQRF